MDTKTWWIIIAIIVVVLILILIAAWQGKRRTAARRDKAQQLRGRARENEATVVESRQRAESTAEQAERARAEAEAKQQEADRLAAEAEHEKKTAAAVERDHAETLRRADRLDPDTPTDRHGNRVEGTGSHGDGAGESRIDPNTGQPVEEAARQRDDRAGRGSSQAAAPMAYDEQRDVRPEGDRVGNDGHDPRERQHVVRPDGSVGDARPAAYDQERDVRPDEGRPDGAVGSHAATDSPRRDGDLPAADGRRDGDLPAADGSADESDGFKPRDTVNRLFGRHARDNGPEDGVEPPKH